MTNLQTDEKLIAPKPSYDDLPYPSLAHSYSCPEHLYTIGKIFGLKAPAVETAKVLELGCGTGGNSLGFAYRYPKSKVVGIDLSATQIEIGQKMIDVLELKNMELKQMSIADMDESFGKFDYIICNGVFSWVPKDMQDKILEISKKLLTSNGIAYISYNTLPGWNIVSTYREMLQYHTDTFSSMQDKLIQARAFIDFIKEGLADFDSSTPYYKFLENEANIISQSPDSFLKHEYLDKGNSQVYFIEFMNMTASHGFSYLADTMLASMYLGNLPQKAAEQLQVVDDIVRSEQYMDFINNRRFRCTLLCHDKVGLQRNIECNILHDMWLSMHVAPAVPAEKMDFKNPSLSAEFSMYQGAMEAQCSSSNAFVIAALYALSESPGLYLSMDDIVKYVKAKCPKFSEKEDLKVIQTELLNLLFKGMVNIRAVKPTAAKVISTKPAISKLVLMQLINNFPHIYSEYNESIDVSIDKRIVMVNLDGKNTIDQIIQKVSDMLEQSGNNFEIEGKTVTDKGQKMQLIKDLVNNTLQFCLSCGLLVG